METMTEIVDKQTTWGYETPLLDKVLKRLGITRPVPQDLREAITCTKEHVPSKKDEIWIQIDRDFYKDRATGKRAYKFLQVVYTCAKQQRVGAWFRYDVENRQSFLALYKIEN